MRNGELEKQIDLLCTENEEVKSKSVELEGELAETKTSLVEVTAKSEVSVQDIERIQTEKVNLASTIEELTTERNQLVEKNMEIQFELADKDSSLASLKDTNRSRDTLQQDLDHLKQQAKETESQIEVLTVERDDWKKEAEISQQRANEAESEVQAVQEQMEQMQRADRDAMDGEMKSVQIQIDDLLTERTELKTCLAKEQESVATAETEISSLRSSLAGMAALQIEIERLTDSNLELSSQLASLATQRDELQSSAAIAESRSVEARSTVTALEAERDELRLVKKESDTLRDQNMQVMMQVAELQSEQAKLRTAASRVDEVELTLAESRQALVESEKQFVDLESQYSDMESTNANNLKSEQAKLSTALSRIDETEEALEESRDALAESEKQLADLEIRYRDMESAHAEHLQSERAKLSSASSSVDEVQAALAESRQALVESEKRFADLEIRYNDMESTNVETLKLEQAKLNDALSRVDETEAAFVESSDALAESEKRLSDLEIQYSDMESTNTESLQSERAKLNAASSKADEVQAELAESRQALVETGKQLADLEVRYSDMESTNAENLQLEQAKLSAASSRIGEAESALDESKQALVASEKQLADLEVRYSAMETKVEELIAEREELQVAVDKAQLERTQAQAAALSSSDLEKEYTILLEKNAALEKECKETQNHQITIEDELDEVSSERDALLDSIVIAEDKAAEASKALAAATADATALKKETDELRDRLNLSSEEDVVVALEHLQQDYSDLLDDNDRLRENMVDFEAEIDELVAERDDWMAQAQKATPGTSPETSRSTTEPQGMDGMMELCEELQRQLQSVTRDRDTWKETAESATRAGNKGEKKRNITVSDDSSVMSDMSDQKILLQQAVEYRERRDSKKPSGIFSFTTQRPAATDAGANEAEREELIDRLTESQEQNEQTIEQLKKEVVLLNTSLKEDAYASKKRTDVIDQENQAYELKCMMLEQEIERLSAEAGTTMGPKDTKKLKALETDLSNFQKEKKDAEREIASLQADFDKLHRATTQDVVHKQTEIDHLKTIQADFQAKVDALENMMLAIDQENETLREVAQKAANFSLESDLGKKLEEDDKDVKIAQLHHQLIELRMQGHQQLADKVLSLQDEKRQMQIEMEKHYEIVAEENGSILEDLEMRLQAREETIKQLEAVLDQLSGVSAESLSGSQSRSSSTEP